MVFERPLNESSGFAHPMLPNTSYVAWVSWGLFDMPNQDDVGKVFGDRLIPDGHLFEIR